KGKWLGSYVPAFVRRYPFVLNIDPENQKPLVLIDEAYDGLSTTDGDRLFEEDGTETEITKSMLAFLGDFKAQGELSNEFMTRIKKFDLLVPQAMVVNRGDQPSITLDGFHIVDEKRLLALDDAATLELARSGDMARIHMHLLSLNNIQKLVQRLNEKLAVAAAVA
ncbi:MAG TPA: SapC family protein, partial [Burkholderiaceae bacterium]|nr:SapC family protein [Burkholderiaceae bacterium]